MNISFTDPKMTMCQKEYNELDPEQRLTMSHFDLAQQTNIDDPDIWLTFLKDPRVADKINEDLTIFTAAQQRKLIQRATTHDKSVGTAQMINALSKTKESEQPKTGTMMIYSYVPLNNKEMQSPHVRKNTYDLFEK